MKTFTLAFDNNTISHIIADDIKTIYKNQSTIEEVHIGKIIAIIDTTSKVINTIENGYASSNVVYPNFIKDNPEYIRLCAIDTTHHDFRITMEHLGIHRINNKYLILAYNKAGKNYYYYQHDDITYLCTDNN
jgi:hypothetical protein